MDWAYTLVDEGCALAHAWVPLYASVDEPYEWVHGCEWVGACVTVAGCALVGAVYAFAHASVPAYGSVDGLCEWVRV